MSKLKTLVIVSTLLLGSSVAMSASAGFGHGGGHRGQMGGYGMNGDTNCGMAMQGNMGQGMHMKGGKHRGGMMGMFWGVNLTSEQQQKIQDIMKQGQAKMASIPRASFDDMAAMHNLVTSDKFDETQVRSQLEARNKLQIDRRLEMAKIHHEAYQVLTAEQKAQAKANYDARATLMKSRLNAMQNMAQAPVAP